ncbi:MAG: hypothetical protein NTX49_07735 [Chlamydiae bacterium]|nr:hypothetical protein [Chlamydiota bacterium]
MTSIPRFPTEDPIAIHPICGGQEETRIASSIYQAMPISSASTLAPSAQAVALPSSEDGAIVVPLPPLTSYLEAINTKIKNPREGSSYCVGSLEDSIPPYVKQAHPKGALTQLFSAVKKEAKAPGFTLNPLEKLAEGSTLARLAELIASNALGETQDTRPTVDLATGRLFPIPLKRFAQIFAKMNAAIEELHHKEISPEKRALIEVALRKRCAEALMEKTQLKLYDLEGTPLTLTKEFLPIMRGLHDFVTRSETFKPVMDVKALLTRPIEGFVTESIETLRTQATPADSVAVITSSRERLEAKLSALLKEQPEKAAYVAGALNVATQKTIAQLQQAVAETPFRPILAIDPASSTDAIELRKNLLTIKALLVAFPGGNTSLRSTVVQSLRGHPSIENLDGLLLFAADLLANTPEAERDSLAKDLRNVVLTLEKRRYEPAAVENKLPESWFADFTKIKSCLLPAVEGTDPASTDTFLTERVYLRLLLPLTEKIEQELETRRHDLEIELGHPPTIEEMIRLCGLDISVELQKIEKKAGFLGFRSLRAERTTRPALINSFINPADEMQAQVFLSRYLHNHLAQHLSAEYSSANSTKEKAQFQTKGYFPEETFSDAIALQSLATKRGMFASRTNFLQEKIISTFGTHEQILEQLIASRGRVSALQASSPSSLLTTQIRTLEWALSMLEAGRTTFESPPVAVAPEKKAPPLPSATIGMGAPSAPLEEIPASAPVAPRPPRQVIQLRATDRLEIDTSHPDWYQRLPREQRLCLLANVVLKLYGENERLVEDYFRTEGVDAKRTLTSLERRLPEETDCLSAAQRILASYALREDAWDHRRFMDRIRDSGISSEEAFLQHVYDQSKEELYVGEREIAHEPAGQRAWAESHWYRDVFDGTAPAAIRNRHRENVFQALQRHIMA